MAEQLNNVLFYDKNSAKYQLPDTANDTFRLNMDSTIGGDMTITGATTLSGILSLTGAATMSSNLTVDGNLIVKGSTDTVHSETVLLRDNYLDLNHGYSSDAAQQGGLTVNYDPTTTKTTSASFTAGAGSDSPKVTVASSSGFAANDIIQISDATDNGNDGLYIILSISSNDLNVYGITGTSVPAAHTWAKNQFVTDSDDTAATVCKVNISVMKVDSSGDWQVGKGANIGSLSYAAIQTGTDGTPTLDQVYDSGNEITTDSSGGNVLISGDQKLEVTATGGVKVSAGVLDVDSSADFDVSAFTVDVSGAGFSIDGAGASNVTTSSGPLTLQAAGNASLTSSGGTVSINDSAGSIEMASGAVSTTGVASFALAPSGAFDVDAGAAMTLDAASFTVGGDGDTGAIAMTATSAAMTLTAAGINLAGGSSEVDITTSATLDVNVGVLDIVSSGNADIQGVVTTLKGSTAVALESNGKAMQNANGVFSDSSMTSYAFAPSDAYSIIAGGAASMTATGAGSLAGATATVQSTSGDLNLQASSALAMTGASSSLTTTGAFTMQGSANSSITAVSSNLTLQTAISGDVDIIAAGALDVEANSASEIECVGANLTLKTTTSGALNLESAGQVLLQPTEYTRNRGFFAVNGNNPVTDSNGAIGIRMQAAESISTGDVLYIGDGGFYKADADVAAKAFPIAVATENMSAGSTFYNGASVCGSFVSPTFDSAPNQSDLGSRVFLSTTPGVVSLNPPTTSGAFQYQVGHLIYKSGSTSGNLIVWAPQFLAEVP